MLPIPHYWAEVVWMAPYIGRVALPFWKNAARYEPGKAAAKRVKR